MSKENVLTLKQILGLSAIVLVIVFLGVLMVVTNASGKLKVPIVLGFVAGLFALFYLLGKRNPELVARRRIALGIVAVGSIPFGFWTMFNLGIHWISAESAFSITLTDNPNVPIGVASIVLTGVAIICAAKLFLSPPHRHIVTIISDAPNSEKTVIDVPFVDIILGALGNGLYATAQVKLNSDNRTGFSQIFWRSIAFLASLLVLSLCVVIVGGLLLSFINVSSRAIVFYILLGDLAGLLVGRFLFSIGKPHLIKTLIKIWRQKRKRLISWRYFIN